MNRHTPGKVTLVGAGPGDAGLLTLKGAQAIKAADVILYDHLVGKGILSSMPASAELIYVGKCAGNHFMKQEEINSRIKDKALEGKQVVRLKGGDPFVFGRGGEELEGLKEEGIPFEVVPGVSSALAVPAYAGIPVTHRDCCSALHIITAHSRNAPAEGIDFNALVKAEGTLIFLMGVCALPQICEGLLQAGMPATTPAAILQSGTTARERNLISTLAELPRAAKEAAISPPAITVVGEVCEYAEELQWRESLPLFGIRIALTRPAERGSKLSELLASAGAEVIALPSITTISLEEKPSLSTVLTQLKPQDWIAFTSPIGAKLFFEKVRAYGIDVRSLQGIHFAAIGKATADEIEKHGVLCELVPQHYDAESLGKQLAATVKPGATVLLARSRIATDNVLNPLREAEVTYIDVPLYDVCEPAGYSAELYAVLTEEGFDWIAFTSASTVEGLVDLIGIERMKNARALCIGQQTRQAAEALGLKTATAENATLECMVEKLIEEVHNK